LISQDAPEPVVELILDGEKVLRGVFEIGHYGRVLRTYCCATPFGTSVLSPRQDVVR
jgi:hypothetical protein